MEPTRIEPKTLITKEVLTEWEACSDGLNRFCELFPEGADLKTAAEKLAEDGRSDWSVWLFEKCRSDERFKEQAKEGFQNTGHSNAGSWNAGEWNAGQSNAGSCNAGSWNAGSWNAGHFNTITPSDILIFNRPCKLSIWEECKKPNLIYNLVITWWVPESEMTDAEKAADPDFYVRGGQLRSRTYKEAWRKAWEDANKADRELVKQLPNFDPLVFLEITGIDVNTQENFQ